MRSPLLTLAGAALLSLAVPSATAAPGNISFATAESIILTEDAALTPEAQITVVRTEGTDGAVTAELAAVPLSGLESADYPPLRYRMNAASPWTVLPWRGTIPLSFPDGAAEVTFQVQAIDNDAWEGTSSAVGPTPFCTLTLQNVSTPAAAGAQLTKRIQLQGNDPAPVMTITPLTAQEGNGQGTVTRYVQVNLDRAIARRTIRYTASVVAGGTATNGTDFGLEGLPQVPITLPAYTKSFQVPVVFVRDDVTEPDETFTLNIELTGSPVFAGSDTLTLTGQALVTIQNDEFPAVTVGNASVIEGHAGSTASLVFPVSLTAPLAQAVSFQWSTQPGGGAGTATPGADYVAASGTLTIPAGSTAGSITVTVNGDSAVEPDESVGLTLSAPVGVSFPETIPTGTIFDDDTPRLIVANASIAEGNSGLTSLVFPVTLTVPQLTPVTFTWNVSSNTALAGSDFQTSTGTLTIPEGQTTAAITIKVIGDTAAEPDETFYLQLSNSSGPPLPATPPTGTIVNDDLPVLSIMYLWQTTAETDSNLSNSHMNVVLSGSPGTGPRSVDYAVEGPPGSITPMSGRLDFSSTAFASPVFTVIGDDIPEADATYRIKFSNPIGLSLANGSEFHLLTIVDDDRPTVTAIGGAVPEGNAGASNLEFTVTINAAPATDLTFNYTTGTGTATASQDYTAAGGTATIAAGTTSTVINVSVSGDTQIEPDETVSLTLSNFSQPVDLGNVTAGTILTDDFPPAATPVDTLVTEASGTGTVQAWFEVKLSAARAEAFTCRVSTRSGSAFAGSDFNALADTDVTFAPGETQKWVAITITATPAAEPREQFYLDVKSLDSGEIKSATCTIERLAITDFWRPFATIYAVRFPTGLGQRYIIDEAASLAGPWVPASPILTGSGFPVTQLMFSESDSGFFRVRAAPPLPPGTPAAGS